MREDLQHRFRSALADLGVETPDMARAAAAAAEPLVKALLREHARRSGRAAAVRMVAVDARARTYVRAFGRSGLERLADEQARPLAHGRKAWRELSETMAKSWGLRG